MRQILQVQDAQTKYLFPSHMMPSRATPIEVISLVEAVEHLGGTIKLSDLARLFSRYSTPHSLSVVKAAQKLGLIKRDGDLLSLTDLGLGFARAVDGKESIIRAGLARIEPFKTALELLASKKSVSPREIGGALCKKNTLLQRLQSSEDFIRATLIEWGVASKLLSYDGRLFRISR